jgi:hypothetical protein
LSGAATRPLLLPGFLPEQPRLEQRLLLAERLAITADQPGGNGWTAGGFDDLPNDENLTVYAICASGVSWSP